MKGSFAELFQGRFRKAGIFVVGVVFLGALGTLGGSLTLGIFFALALVSLAFVYVLAPETKGRPTGGDPGLLVQRRPLARGDPDVSLRRDRDQGPATLVMRESDFSC